MLGINDLTIQFGGKYLLRNVSARINPRDRIGLVGVNGAGKSTLLKAMAGHVETGKDTVRLAKGCTVGYLPQETTSTDFKFTIFQEAETAFSDLLAAQKELDGIHHKLVDVGAAEDYQLLLKRQGELQEFLETRDIFRKKAEIESVLIGLGFRKSDFDKPCASFSGGWLMRVKLAKILLLRPSLLLLDEPTNHLDLSSLRWMEEYLQSFQGALLVISHDRAFLDNTTSLTWELGMGKLTVYKGNYSRYCAEKEKRLAIQKSAYDNQQVRIRETEHFIGRFRSKATKARQVQSRVRLLEKLDRIEPVHSERNISFRFPPSLPCGRRTIEVSGLSKEYNGAAVLSDINFQLDRGDKLAVVGENGAGKSTLARIIAGLERPGQGEVRYGHNVRISYYGQHQARELSPEKTALEILAEISGDLPLSQLRSLLGVFFFKGDDVDKRVRVLSGGEKSRLALARVMITSANLLIMDEPTNHLDMLSQEVLRTALAEYDGTCMVISHNRHFLNGFVNKTLELKHGGASLFHGDLDYYLWKISEENTPAGAEGAAGSTADVPQHKNGLPGRGKAARRINARIRDEKKRRLAPFKEKSARAERRIEELEARKIRLEMLMSNPESYKTAESLPEWSREYKLLERELAEHYHEWEEALANMEEIERAYSWNFS